jgi:hypothetical protein
MFQGEATGGRPVFCPTEDEPTTYTEAREHDVPRVDFMLRRKCGFLIQYAYDEGGHLVPTNEA